MGAAGPGRGGGSALHAASSKESDCAPVVAGDSHPPGESSQKLTGMKEAEMAEIFFELRLIFPLPPAVAEIPRG